MMEEESGLYTKWSLFDQLEKFPLYTSNYVDSDDWPVTGLSGIGNFGQYCRPFPAAPTEAVTKPEN